MWTQILIYVVIIGLALAIGSVWWGAVSTFLDRIKGRK